MKTRRFIPHAIVAALLAFIPGCTIHPAGEREERQSASDAGKSFSPRLEDRVAALPANPGPDDLVQCALQSNALVEQRYWEWRAAIEQIPQDGTQAATLTVSAGTIITRGKMSAAGTSVGVLNDPMTDLHWPPTLAIAARRSLENARAAGWRFRKAQFELRNDVLAAYYDFALNAELIRLQQADIELMQMTATLVEARNRAGLAGQVDLLKARTELDLSRNDIASMQAQIPAQRAALNALLGRNPNALLPMPESIPAAHTVYFSDERILELAQAHNPELAALGAEFRARQNGIELAKSQYIPDFNLSLSTDLAGIAQNLAGSATLPLLRYEAIRASVAQAEANFRASEAARRQMKNDLAAQLIMDMNDLRDIERQLMFYDQTILPRASLTVSLTRGAYETGKLTLLDLLDSQRSLLSIQRLVTKLRIAREKRLADLERVIGIELKMPTLRIK